MNKTARILSLPDQIGRLGTLDASSGVPAQGDDGRGLLATAPVSLPVMIDGQEVHFEARAFRSALAGEEAIALIHRRVLPNVESQVPLVRVHSGCVTGDIFHSLRCDCHEQLQSALRRVKESAFGIIVYLPAHEGRGIGLFQKLRAYALQEQGLDTVDANIEIGAPVDGRDYALTAAILRAIGVDAIRLLTNNPRKEEALKEHKITVMERIPLVATPNAHNERYLKTKRERLSHLAWDGEQ